MARTRATPLPSQVPAPSAARRRARAGLCLLGALFVLPFAVMALTGAREWGALLGCVTGPVVVLLYAAMCDESTPARHSATRITARTLTGVRSVNLTRLSRVRLLTFFSYGRVFHTLAVSDADGVWLGISTSAGQRAVRRALTRRSGDYLLPRPRVSRAARAFLDGDRPGRLAVHTVLAFLAMTVGISGYVGVLLTLGGLLG